MAHPLAMKNQVFRLVLGEHLQTETRAKTSSKTRAAPRMVMAAPAGAPEKRMKARRSPLITRGIPTPKTQKASHSGRLPCHNALSQELPNFIGNHPWRLLVPAKSGFYKRFSMSRARACCSDVDFQQSSQPFDRAPFEFDEGGILDRFRFQRKPVASPSLPVDRRVDA